MRSHTLIQQELIKAKDCISDYPAYVELVDVLNKRLELSDIEIYKDFYKIVPLPIISNRSKRIRRNNPHKILFDSSEVASVGKAMVDCLMNIHEHFINYWNELTQNIEDRSQEPMKFENAVCIYNFQENRQLSLIDKKSLIEKKLPRSTFESSQKTILKYYPEPKFTIIKPFIMDIVINACKNNNLVLVKEILQSSYFMQYAESAIQTDNYNYYDQFFAPLLNNEFPKINMEIQKCVLGLLHFYPKKDAIIYNYKKVLFAEADKLHILDSKDKVPIENSQKDLDCKFDRLKNMLSPKDCLAWFFKEERLPRKKMITKYCKDMMAEELNNQQEKSKNMFFFFAVNEFELNQDTKNEINEKYVRILLNSAESQQTLKALS